MGAQQQGPSVLTLVHGLLHLCFSSTFSPAVALLSGACFKNLRPRGGWTARRVSCLKRCSGIASLSLLSSLFSPLLSSRSLAVCVPTFQIHTHTHDHGPPRHHLRLVSQIRPPSEARLPRFLSFAVSASPMVAPRRSCIQPANRPARDHACLAPAAAASSLCPPLRLLRRTTPPLVRALKLSLATLPSAQGQQAQQQQRAQPAQQSSLKAPVVWKEYR